MLLQKKKKKTHTHTFLGPHLNTFGELVSNCIICMALANASKIISGNRGKYFRGARYYFQGASEYWSPMGASVWLPSLHLLKDFDQDILIRSLSIITKSEIGSDLHSLIRLSNKAIVLLLYLIYQCTTRMVASSHHVAFPKNKCK